MVKVLKDDYDLDLVQAPGDYLVVIKGRARELTVTTGKDTYNVGYVAQTLTAIDDRSEMRRSKYKGGWSPWYGKLDERALNDAISHINRIAAGVPPASDKVDGLMSAADKAKLDGINPGADKTPDIDRRLTILVEHIGKIVRDTYALKDHEHNGYVSKRELGDILQKFVNREEFTRAAIMKMIHDALVEYNVSDFKGTEKFLLANAFTAENVKKMLGSVDASTFQGKNLSYFAPRDHTHGEYMPAERAGVGKHPSQTIKGGSFIPNPAKGRLQYYANAGDHTFEAPQVPFEGTVLITNMDGAGVITFKNFTVPLDDLPATPGAQYLVRLTKVGPVSLAEVKVLKTGGE
jgi:hypothetical protein